MLLSAFVCYCLTMSDRARLSARVDAEVMLRVVERAKREGRTVSNMIERLLLLSLNGGGGNLGMEPSSSGTGAGSSPAASSPPPLSDNPFPRAGVLQPAAREFKPDPKKG